MFGLLFWKDYFGFSIENDVRIVRVDLWKLVGFDEVFSCVFRYFL